VTAFNWSPRIGDPSLLGWVTVAMYFVTTWLCWRVTALPVAVTARERTVWRCIALLFLVLGVNKQLDIQTAVTEIGRIVAHHQGWYERRGPVQLAFVGIVAVVCLHIAAILLTHVRGAPAMARLALAGTTLVLGFVTIRAASFHHVDTLIGKSLLGFRWNWLLEIAGIAIVLAASYRRQLADPDAGREELAALGNAEASDAGLRNVVRG
jgi:hypothetical protein